MKFPTTHKTGSDKYFVPVIAFDKVVLQEDLAESYHEHSVDIILHTNTGYSGEFC